MTPSPHAHIVLKTEATAIEIIIILANMSPKSEHFGWFVDFVGGRGKRESSKNAENLEMLVVMMCCHFLC